MASREEKKAQLELHIYNTAIDLFCEHGYRSVTLTDIATAAEVSTRTLYRYYPTKDTILLRFCRENMMALKEFTRTLDPGIPLKDKIVAVMMQDFKQMFCIFDPGHVLHCGRDNDSGLYSRFEMENVFELESIYAKLFEQEQLDKEVPVTSQVLICASIVSAIYRHCNDVYRFRFKRIGKEENLDELQELYYQHLNTVWDSLYSSLLSGENPHIIGIVGDYMFSRISESSSSRE